MLIFSKNFLLMCRVGRKFIGGQVTQIQFFWGEGITSKHPMQDVSPWGTTGQLGEGNVCNWESN